MKNCETAKWQCRYKVSKYIEDIGQFRGGPEEFRRTFKPYEVRIGEGNCLLDTGITEIWGLVCGDSASHFNNAGAQIGVGDSAVAADAAQTDLQASVNKAYKGMDAGYPALSGRKAVFQASFGGSEANYAWNEWVVKQGTSGKCLNRKAENMGIKSGGTWVLQVEITLA